MIGKQFEQLTVLSVISPRKGQPTKCLCKCSCGTLIEVRKNDLERNNTKSCGCLRKKNMQKIGMNNKQKWGGAAVKSVYTSYRIGASKRKLEFLLSLDEVESFIFSKCFYCGKEPSNKKSIKDCYGYIFYNGIDRKDNNIGYVLANCVSCCSICNVGKRTMSYDNWISHLDNLTEFRKQMKGKKNV